MDSVHWQSEDGTTEIWLHDWKKPKVRLIVELPDQPAWSIGNNLIWNVWAYKDEVAQQLKALCAYVFGSDAVFEALPILLVGTEKLSDGVVYGRSEWAMGRHRQKYEFVGMPASDFDVRTNWQEAMGQKMLESPST